MAAKRFTRVGRIQVVRSDQIWRGHPHWVVYFDRHAADGCVFVYSAVDPGVAFFIHGPGYATDVSTPSETLRSLVEGFHLTKATAPLVDKLCEEYPDFDTRMLSIYHAPPPKPFKWSPEDVDV